MNEWKCSARTVAVAAMWAILLSVSPSLLCVMLQLISTAASRSN